MSVDQTPAPARRFLPPTSSSSSKPWTSLSGRKAPFSLSQGSFTSSSASPFTRSSRFEIPAKPPQDDICASFDTVDSSPLVSARGKALQAASERDGIEDKDLSDVSQPEGEPGHQSLSPPWDATAAASSELEYAIALVTPSFKRRKISASQSRKSTGNINIASSPEQLVNHFYGRHVEQAFSEKRVSTDLHDDGEPSSPGLITPPMPTRFKTPIATRDSTNVTRSKPLFRPFAKESSLGVDSDSALPDAFSPSRRRGKRDYIPGGLADTVRNWVLNAATEEIQTNHHNEQAIELKEADLDRTGRAFVITDTVGERWLLVDEQSRNLASDPLTTLERLRGRGRVVIKGRSTNWVLPDTERDETQVIHVAVRWEVG